MSSFVVVNSIFGYKLFEYLLNSFGLIKDSWVVDAYKNEFNEYAPGLFLIRTIYFIVIFLVTIPLLLKKDLESLKNTTKFFVVTLLFLIFVILIESPFFRYNYTNHPDPKKPFKIDYFKNLDIKILPMFFSFIGCFYSQPFVLNIRK